MSLAKKINKALQKNGTLSGIMKENDISDIPYYVDTGSVVVNLITSGKFNGGVPAGMLTMFAGEKSSGKTFIATNVMKSIQRDYEGTPVLVDSEFASTSESLESFGINTEEMLYLPLSDIKNEDKERSISYQLNVIDKEIDKEDKVIIVLDSLGMTTTQRTQGNIEANNTSKDMSVVAERKALLQQMLQISAYKKVPTIVINHSYEAIGSFTGGKVVSGGGALYYPSNVILIQSKAKWRDENTKEQIGNIFTAVVYKGRLSRENSKVKFAISYENGLSRYYNLEQYALEGEYIEESKDGRSTVYKIKDTDLVVRKKNLHATIDDDYNKFWEYLFTNTSFGEYCDEIFAYGSKKKLKSLVIEDEEK